MAVSKIKINLFIYNKISTYQDNTGIELIKAIQNGNYNSIKVLKNNQRSFVELIEYNNSKLILKIPKEKNTRRWIRFTTLFRSGEGRRALDNMLKLQNLGLQTTIPVVLFEKRTCGFLTDSFYIYKYGEAEAISKPHFDKVIDCLNFLHSKNFLHHDAHLDNFYIKDNKVFLIDANIKKMRFFKGFQTANEFAYLAKMNPEIIPSIKTDKQNFYRKLAELYQNYLDSWRKFKRMIRKQTKIN